ncbi:PAS domain-containing protein [Stieleria sp. TO1_6]|uniref:chemotaxis protein CheB n=1 Tax=Stieleria tagensis TaxID=2956795 RepID=UPI00209BAB08|nr:chemotaxis protein CheB [Stieleria tagensis]MCO8121294.1 PAS domain-containing protein [Stieleria tagensis]
MELSEDAVPDHADCQDQDNESDCDQFHVVGVGASAGGLEAIETFFEHMPVDSGMAFVVVQHLSPDFKSHMDELIARKTQIPVQQVDNATPLKPNRIYLLPAKMEMEVRDGKLMLSHRDAKRSLSRPIDLFFNSLAEDVGDCGIGIVLSGTGSDGSLGLKAIHDAGGLVMAQDELSAKFDGMPLSAQATGIVDVVLPPQEMPDALMRYTVESVPRDKLANVDLVFESASGLEQIFVLLDQKFGIDFSEYKSSTVGRRIQRRMDLTAINQLEQYVQRLTNDSHELDTLYRDLLIGVTRFFRDDDAYETLASHVIPQLFARENEGRELRIWVAGCASGEEAYSVAMLLDEERRRSQSDVDFKLFATDAHPASIQNAARGLFAEQAVLELSDERRNRYFRRESDGYQVVPELRKSIVFATHNLIKDAPFTQMDLVSCRNMLIYLQPAAQSKALSLFHFALKPGGTLWLGPSESTGDLSDEFNVIDPHWRLYSKRRNTRMPVGTPMLSNPRTEKMPRLSFLRSPVRAERVDRKLVGDYDELLDQKLGRSLLVSRSGEILHVFGGAEKYLRFVTGRPSVQVLDSIDERLKASLSAALHHATRKGATVRYASIPYPNEDGFEQLEIQVEPVGDFETGSGNMLVQFRSVGPSPPPTTEQTETEISEIKIGQVAALESELRFSQENLQATIEEMETSNEELQASNEELVASNEELQSTNEELHSVNEELYTVNAEHQRRVEELAESNADMDNLLAITRVGVLFLDSQLRLRRFTPAIAELLDLSPLDLGRSIDDFAHRLNHDSLHDDLKSVLRSDQMVETKMTDKDGSPHLMRIVPYRSGDSTRGVVLTLIDISSLAEAELQLRMHHLAMEATLNGIVITDPNQADNPITYANPGFSQLTGYEREDVIGRNCRFLQGELTDPDTVKQIHQAVRAGSACRATILNYRKDGTSFWNDLQITPVFDENRELTSLVGVQQDVTDRIKVQRALQEANLETQRASEAKSAFMANMSHELRTPMTAVLGFADMLAKELADEIHLEKVNTIKRNGEYLLTLLNDILDLSKIEAGQLEIAKDELSVEEIISDVQELMDVRSSQEGIPLEFQWAAQIPKTVTGDKTRIRQILVNLIGNALKFTDSGQVRVHVDAASDGEQGHCIQFAVHDTGIGIHSSHLEELFTPFSQSGIERRRRFGGTGLGLSICKRLANGMGGTISVASKLGVGSTFTFSLPLTESQFKGLTPIDKELTTNQQPAPRKHDWPEIDARILLADDRRDIWRIGKYFLEKAGAVVTVVEDGLQAVEETKRAVNEDRMFDLIIMDMQMPVMTGPEAIAEIRQLGFELPIIALTADVMAGEREACLAMGCNDYLPKPIDARQLLTTVAKHLPKQK